LAVPDTLGVPDADADAVAELALDAVDDEDDELLQPAAASPAHAMPSSAAARSRARFGDLKRSIPRR
jgi:hypothetical protein